MPGDAPDFDEIAPRRPSLSLWLAAAFVVAVVHIGGVVLVLAHPPEDDSDEAQGAPAIEIGLELAAPRLEPSELPPGPEAEASVASPAVVEQKAATAPTELPQAVPTETDDPDRLVTRDNTPKPKEEEPETATVQINASNEAVASEATAPPSSDTAVEAPRSTAPVDGTGQQARRERTIWQKQMLAHFDKNKRYPEKAPRRELEIVVAFALDRTGHVLSASVLQGSGDAAYDAAALAMLRRADPVPAPPPLVADSGLNFTVPVVFHQKARGR